MNRLVRLSTAAALALGLLFVPTGAEAQAITPLDRLAIVLATNHQDPDPALLERFRPGLYQKLQAIESDGARPRISRIRALAAMAREDADRTLPRLAQLIDDAGAAPRLRLAAGWTLGEVVPSHPLAVPTLSRLLSDPDPGLRERAVLSLAKIGTPPALHLIEQQRIVERHIVVRTALRQVAAEARGLKPEQLPREGRSRTPVLRLRSSEKAQADTEVQR